MGLVVKLAIFIFFILEFMSSKVDFLKYLEEGKESLIKNINLKPNMTCEECLDSVNFIQKAVLNQKSIDGIKILIRSTCLINFDDAFCAQVLHYYGSPLAESLLLRTFNPNYICSRFHYCDADYYTTLSADDFAQEILKDKPTEYTKTTNINKYSFVQLTDIHIDFKYIEGSLGDCDEYICCRAESDFMINNNRRAGSWGFLGKCDIPLKTFYKTIDFMRSELKPDFIIWTGDNPSHQFVDASGDEPRYTSDFLNKEFKKFFNGTKIYPSLGNHEMYPLDMLNVFNNTETMNFFGFHKSYWKEWIGEEAADSFAKFGYYTVKHDDILRIISLNSFLGDNFNTYLVRNPSDPLQQIEWLRNVLTKAEKDNEHVIIISHIPPNDSFFNTEYSLRFTALFDRFSHIIIGTIFGHNHSDEINIVNSYFEPKKPIGITQIAPSLTTFENRYPSIRQFIYEEDRLTNYFQYYFNITEENPEFKLLYSAKEFFGLKDLNDFEGLLSFLDRIKDDYDVLRILCINLDGAVCDKIDFTSEKYFKKIKCKFTSNTFDAMTQCIGGPEKLIPQDLFLFLVEHISGKWFKIKTEEP